MITQYEVMTHTYVCPYAVLYVGVLLMDLNKSITTGAVFIVAIISENNFFVPV